MTDVPCFIAGLESMQMYVYICIYVFMIKTSVIVV